VTKISAYLRQNFPSLALVSPTILQRNSRVIGGVDLDLVLFQGVIADSVKFCELQNEPLEFKYGNGKHGVRLIKLPMSMNNNGTVTPKIKPCIDEIIACFGD
jgi:hypothetical protein